MDAGTLSTRIIVDTTRRQLADEWRRRADRLDAYGSRLRRDGDVIEAQDAEQAAVEYRIAADELEPGLTS